MLTVLQAANLSEAQLNAYLGDRLIAEPQLNVHPDNAAVFTLLTQCSACFVTDNGTLTGFRYHDAQQIAHWQQLDAAACQRLPLAVNAILQGKG